MRVTLTEWWMLSTEEHFAHLESKYPEPNKIDIFNVKINEYRILSGKFYKYMSTQISHNYTSYTIKYYIVWTMKWIPIPVSYAICWTYRIGLIVSDAYKIIFSRPLSHERGITDQENQKLDWYNISKKFH